MRSRPSIEAGEFGQIPDDASPLYSRISSRIRERIRDRRLPAGTKLPTEDELARHFGVSSITIRAALKELADTGVIDRRQGRGTFTREPQAAEAEWALGSIEDLIMTSRLSQVRLVRHGFRVPPEWARSVLAPLPDGRSFNVQVIRSKSDTPFLLTDAYFPPAIGERLAAVDVPAQLEKNSLLIGMVEEVTGERYAEIRQTMVAAGATATVARLLQIRAGTPLLLITRLSRAADGRLLQVARSHYRTRGFAYSIHLKRSSRIGAERLPQPAYAAHAWIEEV